MLQGVAPSTVQIATWRQFFAFIAWPLLTAAFLLFNAKRIAILLEALVWRIRTGGAVEFGGFRLPSVANVNMLITGGENGSVTVVKAANLSARRDAEYDKTRRIMLVHRLAPSKEPGQLYDCLLYLVPHNGRTKQGADLSCIRQVDYFFGNDWGLNKFTVTDRSSAFAIKASSYNGFLAMADITFSDDTQNPVRVWRYIDFEMGQIGKPIMS